MTDNWRDNKPHNIGDRVYIPFKPGNGIIVATDAHLGTTRKAQVKWDNRPNKRWYPIWKLAKL